MKITKSILTTAVLAAISGSVFAAETTLPSNVYSNVDGMTTVGNNNRVIDTTLSNQSTVVGANNSIKRATENTTIIGANIAIDGKNNVALGAHNDIAGHDSVVVGFHSGAAAYKELADDEMPDLTVNPAAEGVGATIIGSHSRVYNQLSTAIGYNTQASGENNIALGAYSVVSSNVHAADTKYAGVSNNKGVLSIGAYERAVNLIYDGMPTPVEQPWQDDFTRQIQRVSAGEVSATSTDAINGSQLQDAFDRSAANATNIATNAANIIKAKTSVTAGNGVTVTDSTNADGSTNYEVAVASAITDKLDTLANTAVVAAGKNLVVTNVNGNRTVALADDINNVHTANFTTGGNLHTHVSESGVAVHNGSARTITSATGILIENGDTLTQAQFDTSGMTASDDNGSVAFTTHHIFANDQIIHGVKAGVADTDAVNVKQLKDFMSSNDKDTITTVKAGNRIKVTNTGHDYTVALDDKTVDQINNTETGVKGNARDIAKLKVDVVEAKTSVSVGDGLHVKPSYNTNGSTNYHVTIDSKVTDQIKGNTDAIKANSTNIADNKARIDDLANKIDTNNSNYNRVISNNQKEARHGIAGASALAAMHPLDYDPEHKMDVMAGVGHFKGSTAVAIGGAYRPNENLMFTLGASLNGSDSTINAGVTYKVGTDAKDTYHSKASMMNKIKQLETTVEEQNAQIEKLMKIVDALVPANTQA
jgi:putative adhesin